MRPPGERPPVDRRHALSVIGAGVVGGLAFAACGSSKGDSAPSATSAASSSSSSTTAPGSAKPPAGHVTVDMFDKATSCTVAPSQTEGPYYIDVDKVRADIREDRKGARLRVAARVMGVDGCTPTKDAVFEIWHCDAGGLYSGFESASTGGGGGGGGPTDADRFLRGAQVTNADGIAEITTIYPGWYQGRTVHIHAKVFVSNAEVLTTQLYFDEKLNAKVFASQPYSEHPDRSTFNADDSIFSDQTIMTVSKDGDGYLGLITIGVRA